MEPTQAVLLGIIQGLTEFLPVSSSGHLVIFQKLFGLTDPELSFNISVHVGTLIAVIIFFRQEIMGMATACIRCLPMILQFPRLREEFQNDPDVRLVILIGIGSIPTACIGLGFHRVADLIFSSLLIVGITLIITGTMLWSTRGIQKTERTIHRFFPRDALMIGSLQGLAILPGISRSGATIVAGLFLGLSRETAARYSFLLSIPAIVGAELLSIKDLAANQMMPAAVDLIGAATAFVVGYAALKLLVFIVRKGQMHLFAPYCWIVGLTVLAVNFLKGWG